ncbi:MAG: glutaredoxin family protein [Nitrospirota bacterium]
MKGTILFLLLISLFLLQGNFPITANAAAENIILAAKDDPKVELYITTWCPYCQKAITFFESRGIVVTVYDIEKDRDAAVRKNQLDRKRGVPFAVINGKYVHGFSEPAYQKALDGR